MTNYDRAVELFAFSVAVVREGGDDELAIRDITKALDETWNDAIETAARMVHRGTDDQTLEDRVRSLKR